jgi:hypothetical protein
MSPSVASNAFSPGSTARLQCAHFAEYAVAGTGRRQLTASVAAPDANIVHESLDHSAHLDETDGTREREARVAQGFPGGVQQKAPHRFRRRHPRSS